MQAVKEHTRLLLESVGVSRIIVVDDQYMATVEDLIGLCAELDPETAGSLPHLETIHFADPEIWDSELRRRWLELSALQRSELHGRARQLATKGDAEISWLRPDSPDAAAEATIAPGGVPAFTDGMADAAESPQTELSRDIQAAGTLEELLDGLAGLTFVKLSLAEWKTRAPMLLENGLAQRTLFLFDRNFGREDPESSSEGLKLVHEVQEKNVGYCGLITHEVPPGEEHEAWASMAREHNLDRDRFVVISKMRLTGELADSYGFLRMVRLAALSGRCSEMKNAAWDIFQQSLEEAKAAVERLRVLDFDRIVLASSRVEGVWEPETLFRVFGILMRREAMAGLHQNKNDIRAKVESAQKVSALPKKVSKALGKEPFSVEALKIQRFETYEAADSLDAYCLPLELGDVFEDVSSQRLHILLAHPCELMVREGGERSRDSDFGRTGSLVELDFGPADRELKRTEYELPYYQDNPALRVCANFAKVQHVRLVVLDLCALQEEGLAEIEIGSECPMMVIDPWRKRFDHLGRFYEEALIRYESLDEAGVDEELKKLVLPAATLTNSFPASKAGKVIRYGLKRVMRLNQPRSGALLTMFAQYQARAAFEHTFQDAPSDSLSSAGPEETKSIA